jgi:hypothetical protein
MVKGLDLTRVSKIAGKALGKAGEAMSGDSMNKDIMFYDGLDNDDFEALKGEYGENEVGEYIKHMEAKRLGVK